MSETCSECNGETIQFRFSGKDLQHRLCTRWKEPGHKTEAEVKARLHEEKDRAWPPDRNGMRRQA